MSSKFDSIVLLGHGSRMPEANDPLPEMAGWCAERMEGVRVRGAFLQLAEPRAEEVVEELVKEGAGSVCIIPFFLYPGVHVQEDIPELAQKLRGLYPQVEFTVADHLGVHPLMADIVAERAGKV